MKKPTKKPTKKRKPFTFTLREVEDHRPCADGYLQALIQLHSNPVPDGPYARGGEAHHFRVTRYKPDDPISLVDAAEALDSMYINWLCESALIPAELRVAIGDALVEAQDKKFRFAIRKVFE